MGKRGGAASCLEPAPVRLCGSGKAVDRVPSSVTEGALLLPWRVSPAGTGTWAALKSSRAWVGVWFLAGCEAAGMGVLSGCWHLVCLCPDDERLACLVFPGEAERSWERISAASLPRTPRGPARGSHAKQAYYSAWLGDSRAKCRAIGNWPLTAGDRYTSLSQG